MVDTVKSFWYPVPGTSSVLSRPMPNQKLVLSGRDEVKDRRVDAPLSHLCISSTMLCRFLLHLSLFRFCVVVIGIMLLISLLGSSVSPRQAVRRSAIVRKAARRDPHTTSLDIGVSPPKEWWEVVNYGVIVMEPRARPALIWVIEDTLKKIPPSWKVRVSSPSME